MKFKSLRIKILKEYFSNDYQFLEIMRRKAMQSVLSSLYNLLENG